jgi:hypothetical protein
VNDTSPALLYPRCEQLLARLFVALIREDDACSVVRLPGQCSISSPEKPIAIPIPADEIAVLTVPAVQIVPVVIEQNLSSSQYSF